MKNTLFLSMIAMCAFSIVEASSLNQAEVPLEQSLSSKKVFKKLTNAKDLAEYNSHHHSGTDKYYRTGEFDDGASWNSMQDVTQDDNLSMRVQGKQKVCRAKDLSPNLEYEEYRETLCCGVCCFKTNVFTKDLNQKDIPRQTLQRKAQSKELYHDLTQQMNLGLYDNRIEWTSINGNDGETNYPDLSSLGKLSLRAQREQGVTKAKDLDPNLEYQRDNSWCCPVGKISKEWK